MAEDSLKEGVKRDAGKLRMGLLPIRPLLLVGDVYTMGAGKYEDNNWRKGIKYTRIYDALQRHAMAWWAGEQNDPEDHQHHLASVVWCALTLMEYEETKPEYDDRVCQVDQLIATRKRIDIRKGENAGVVMTNEPSEKILATQNGKGETAEIGTDAIKNGSMLMKSGA